MALPDNLELSILKKETNPRPINSTNPIIQSDETLLINVHPVSGPVFIALYNPFSQAFFKKWINSEIQAQIKVKFPPDLASGQYTLHYGTKESEIFYPLHFTGRYTNQQWLITYTVTLDRIPGVEVQVAVPKQYFPFLMVDELEGRPAQHVLTTDVWSNWLIFNLSDFPADSDRIMLGYRAWVTNNYMIFSPESLTNNPKISEKEILELGLDKYLGSEPGLETHDRYIRDFAIRITATSFLGKIHQIHRLVLEHVRYQLQQGEFGAKYALLNRQGDCTEMAALFVTLCRNHFIPARLVAGLKQEKGNNWVRHAWSEVFYEGIWVPIDVVEVYGPGNLPDLIPLFRGNWMAENMSREFKLTILPEFDNSIDLSTIRFDINFKVFPASKAPISIPQIDYFTSLIDTPINHPKIVESGARFDSEIDIKNFQGQTVLLTYYKAQSGEKSMIHPKTILSIKQINSTNINKEKLKITLTAIAPNSPNDYEFGFYAGSIYGQLVSWETKLFTVVPAKFD